MDAGTLRLACQVVALAALGAIAGTSPGGPRRSPSRHGLVAGAVLERRLAGGESHSYRIDAPPGSHLLLTADQRGIDVEIHALRPDGTTLIAVDGVVEGPETLLLPAAGPLEIRVRSPNPGVAPGDYILRLEALPDSTLAERGRIAAERLMTEAAARFLDGTGEALQAGAARYEDAAARWRALRDRRGEARSAVAAGEMRAALGQPRQALAQGRLALARFAEVADAPGQATAWTDIGLALTALGDAAGALDAEHRALDLDRRLGRRREAAKVLDYLGLALHTAGDLRAAKGYYEQALAAFERDGEQGLWKGKVLHNLAAIHLGLGEPEAALRSHGEILALQRRLGDRRGEAQTLNSLGVLYDNLGEFDQALQVYAPALASFRQSGDRVREGALLHNLGSASYGLGDYGRALAYLEQALAIRREAGDRRGEAATEAGLGHAWFRLGETARARAAGRQAATLAGQAADRGGQMLALLLLGQIDVAGGEPAAALAELATARGLARQLADRLDEASVLQVMGQAHLARREPLQAIRVLEEEATLAGAMRVPALLVGAQVALGRAERLRGRPAAARSRLEDALRLIESARATETDPELRASYLAAKHDAFELEIDLLMDLDRQEPGRGHAQAALLASERARARSLLDLLQQAGAEARGEVDAGLLRRQRTLLLRLNGKTSRQAVLLRRPASEASRQAAAAETRAALEDLTQVEAEIARCSPRAAALVRPPLATIAEIQGLLDGDTMLLEYALGEERSRLWAVDPSAVRAYELPPRARIEAAAREVYSRLSVLAPAAGGDAAAAARLSRMLLGPVAARLGRKRLVVAADGYLQFLPFGALPAPGGPARRAPEPLLAGHEVVNVPSASALALLRRLAGRAPAPGAVAVLADPVFDPGDPRLDGRGAGRAADGGRTGGLRSGEGRVTRLAWSRREAEAIAAVAAAAGAAPSLQALDTLASRQLALSPALARYRIVHFATHGFVDARTPALSGLLLSRVGPDGTAVEGFLGMGDIYSLRLGADLVVLSGCETALGKEVRGEGLVGLTQGFLHAGARLVVASLWRVEDQATAELMSHFYRSLLLAERPPAAALREAQLAIRGDRRWRLPYYWSGFVLQGDWEPARRPGPR